MQNYTSIQHPVPMPEELQSLFVSNANLFAVNKRVACEPMVSLAVQKETVTGFAIAKKTTIEPLMVVFDTEGSECFYFRGDFVYIRSESVTSQWAKEVFEVDGTKFILVPQELILLHRTGA